MIETKLRVGRYLDFSVRPQPNAAAAHRGIQRLATVRMHINESTKPGLFGPKTSTTGTGHGDKAHRNFNGLEWRPGLVSEVATHGTDVLTGPMSGCWITRYMRNGVQCVGHVGTEHTHSSANSVAAKLAWNRFRPTAVGMVTGFNPFNDWNGPYPLPKTGQGSPKVFALVTSTGHFYSIFAYPTLETTTLRIAAIQERPSSLPPGDLKLTAQAADYCIRHEHCRSIEQAEMAEMAKRS